MYEEATKIKDQLHLKKLSDYKTLSKVPHIYRNILLGIFKSPTMFTFYKISYSCVHCVHAKGLMDVALLTANCAQLRQVSKPFKMRSHCNKSDYLQRCWSIFSKVLEHCSQWKTLLVILLLLSLFLQVGFLARNIQ